ncbi:MAG: dienelactone hydrolase family protein [Myxococcota bacterium]
MNRTAALVSVLSLLLPACAAESPLEVDDGVDASTDTPADDTGRDEEPAASTTGNDDGTEESGGSTADADSTGFPGGSTDDGEDEESSGTTDPTGEPPPPAELEPTGTLGAHPVGYTETQFTDPIEASRVLPAHIWYPAETFEKSELAIYTVAESEFLDLELPAEAAQRDVEASLEGPFPLVVFSHGYGGLPTQSLSLCETLASHGFVVVSVGHVGNTTTDQENGTSVGFEAAAAHRPRDVQTTIDAMEDLNRDGTSLISGVVDEGQVGVTGHSFGGFTALTSVAGYAPSGALPDPRVQAIAPIAPGGYDFPDASLAAIDVPTLFLAGTEDEPAIEDNVIPFFAAMTAEPRYRVDVVGANHFHFANVCDIGQALINLGLLPEIWPDIGAGQLLDIYDVTCTAEAFPISEALRLQNKYVVAFFRAFLADEGDYAAVLGPDHADACEEFAAVYVEGAPATAPAPCE